MHLKFANSFGTRGGGLLLTGNMVDELDVPGVGKVQVSIIDTFDFHTANSLMEGIAGIRR